MPIPVSVTGFTNKAGSHSEVAASTNIESVLPGSQNLNTRGDVAAVSTQPKVLAQTPNMSAEVLNSTEPIIHVNGLYFTYPSTDGRPIPGMPPLISDMQLKLHPGECSLLLGANGAGKTTLLKIMGGYHMIREDMVSVLGLPPFHTTQLTMSGDLSYIGGSWNREVAFAGNSIPLQGDFSAGKMIEGIRGVDPERRKEIMEVLDINPDWRMHQVSDGQRRRVQLAIGLLKPFKVLLLDEITVDLDVLGRADLLDYLKKDAKKRNSCIFYATHIFDGLEEWFDSIAFVARGQMQFKRMCKDLPEVQTDGLLSVVSGWLREEKAAREKLEAEEDLTQRPKGTYARNNGYSAGTLASTLAGSSNMVWRC